MMFTRYFRSAAVPLLVATVSFAGAISLLGAAPGSQPAAHASCTAGSYNHVNNGSFGSTAVLVQDCRYPTYPGFNYGYDTMQAHDPSNPGIPLALNEAWLDYTYSGGGSSYPINDCGTNTTCGASNGEDDICTQDSPVHTGDATEASGSYADGDNPYAKTAYYACLN